MNVCIDVQDVSFTYEDAPEPALHHVSLQVHEGEFLAVLGHNGSGKSTLAKLSNGILFPQSGQVIVDGTPLTQDEDVVYNARRKVGMVFQNPDNQIVSSIVEEDVAFGVENLGVEPKECRRRVDAALKTVGMYAERLKSPSKLSGGQKQRVAVAVSMICGKDLLVFDEPTSGLDFDSMTQVAGLIRRLSDMGKVIFIVTHDFEFVCRTCSRVLHFDEGEMPDDVSVIMEALPKLRELFSVSDGKER